MILLLILIALSITCIVLYFVANSGGPPGAGPTPGGITWLVTNSGTDLSPYVLGLGILLLIPVAWLGYKMFKRKR